LIFDSSVEDGIPSVAAAPRGPATLPLLLASAATLALSGRIGPEQLADLRRCVEEERGHGVVLDLGEVNLVDVAVVRFLIDCEAQGLRLAQCPRYVQEWMAREKRPS
jgi:hypothetical protein